VVLQRRGVAEEGKPLNQPFTPIAAAVGIVSMIWLAFQGTRQEVSAVLATLVVFSLIYALALRRRING
jgi:hypothetical protein